MFLELAQILLHKYVQIEALIFLIINWVNLAETLPITIQYQRWTFDCIYAQIFVLNGNYYTVLKEIMMTTMCKEFKFFQQLFSCQ